MSGLLVSNCASPCTCAGTSPPKEYAYTVSFSASKTPSLAYPACEIQAIYSQPYLITGPPPPKLIVPSFTVTGEYYNNYAAQGDLGDIVFVQGPQFAQLSFDLDGQVYSALYPATCDGNGNMSAIVPSLDMTWNVMSLEFVGLSNFTMPPDPPGIYNLQTNPGGLIQISGYQNIDLPSLPQQIVSL